MKRLLNGQKIQESENKFFKNIVLFFLLYFCTDFIYVLLYRKGIIYVPELLGEAVDENIISIFIKWIICLINFYLLYNVKKHDKQVWYLCIFSSAIVMFLFCTTGQMVVVLKGSFLFKIAFLEIISLILIAYSIVSLVKMNKTIYE